MTRFVVSRDLNERIAAGPARRHVEEVTGRAAELAGGYAPAAKVWVTAHDERVRPTHRAADRQQIPGNLRYVLEIPDDRNYGQHESTGRTELAVAPRDENLTIANKINCRCLSIELPGIIAAAIRTSTDTHGTTVTGRVSVRYPRIAESNNPSPPDTGGGWMNRALREAAQTRTGR